MSSLVETRPLPIVDLLEALPQDVQDLIEKHTGDFPTKESIDKICKDRLSVSYSEVILKYFLMESPLNHDDLRPLMRGMKPSHIVRVCNSVAMLRKKRELLDWKPRWQMSQ